MDRLALKTITDRWLRFWQGGDLRDFNEVHAVDFVDRSSAGREGGRDGFRQGLVDLYSAFPDFYGEADCLVIDEAADTVAIRWHGTGTHKGKFLGVAPTHRQILFEGVEIIRVKSNRIVERWGEWDGMKIMQQLGIM